MGEVEEEGEGGGMSTVGAGAADGVANDGAGVAGTGVDLVCVFWG